ncbi:hypothetical protein ACFL20_02525, partial [Spirochaetota bacterium]
STEYQKGESMMENHRFVNVKKLSELTTIPAFSIRKMAREGKLTAYKFNGKSYLFHLDEVTQEIKKHRVKK